MIEELAEEDLKDATVLAILEADNWHKVGKIIEQERMYKQNAVIKLLASELYLKSILLCSGQNITKIKKLRKEHNLKILYENLDDSIKRKLEIYTVDKLKKMKIFFPIEITDTILNKKICVYNDFIKALEKISNDFVELRYDYDKVTSRKKNKVDNTIVLDTFISTFEESLKELAYEVYNNK